LVAFEREVYIGPASAVCLLGLLKAFENRDIKNGETVLVNIGEGSQRSPDFMRKIKN